MSEDQFIYLYSCCLITKGHYRSVIYDIQRNTFDFIPNSLYNILDLSRKYNIRQLKCKFCQNDEDIDIFFEYIEFLLEKEYIFFLTKEQMKNFPKLNLKWDYPAFIIDSIIELGNYNVVKPIQELTELGCKHLEIRDFNKTPIETYYLIANEIKNTRISSIHFNISFQEAITESSLTQFCLDYFHVQELIVFNAPCTKIVPLSIPTYFLYTEEKVHNNSHCGRILPKSFRINLKTFTESQKHNTCLNRKISIDAEGNIKNCPSMTKSYGNIRDTTLREAIEKQGFKDVWYIHKDQIEVCKDCEFRYICTDCRAYIQDPNNIYSKPAKCSYNPYTATWGDDNPTNNPLHGK